MEAEKTLRLLAKAMGKAMSDSEMAELKELLLRHPEQQSFIEMLHNIEAVRPAEESAADKEKLIQENWSKLQHELVGMQTTAEATAGGERIKHIRQSRVQWLRYAAIWTGIAAIAGGSFLWWNYAAKQHAAGTAVAVLKQVSLPHGAPEKTILPDGSTVWLNAGSSIRYASNFILNKREVFLDGEAYFDVKHDEAHPFLVHVGNVVIKVLGTEFNVQAYPHEGRIETTLIKGKVQVQIDGKPDHEITLTPNEKLTVINKVFVRPKAPEGQEALSFQVQDVSPRKDAQIREVAWLDDKLTFLNEPFDALAKRMERRYGVTIQFTDTLLKNESLNGTFENENIGKALNVLQMATPFHYRIQHDTVFLSQ
ncbi:FecR domain-containing protein [Chitinophaga sp. MM2321]|uniref:FecR family protein n=1 Tax=Chitinophaga sp. MM2321 TaxID=3137178 RepID=UPI0032D5B04B